MAGVEKEIKKAVGGGKKGATGGKKGKKSGGGSVEKKVANKAKRVLK